MSNYDPFIPRDQQREQNEERRRLAQEQEDEDLRAIMSTPQGRRFVNQILATTGVYRSSYTGNSETFFREGARNVGLTLLNRLTTLTRSEYLLMQEEALNGRASDE